MITARYRTDGESHSLILQGHAYYDAEGRDIVCAGVSAIVYALLGWLENNGEYLDEISYDIGSGDTRIYCEGGERVSAAFDMAAIGLEQIATKYPDHVEIEITGLAG